MKRNHYYVFEDGVQTTLSLPVYDTLVVGGGGFKGCMFLGALHLLEEHGMLKTVRTYCGTSVGAIISLLCVLGYTAQDQMDMLPIHNVYKFQKKPPFIINAVPEALHTFLDESVTFRDLFETSGKFLFVVAFNMTESESRVFSVVTTPDESVIKAVIFSSALPCLEMPSDVKGDRYIDGGVVNNLPIDIADEFDLSQNILTFTISSRHSETQQSIVNDIFNAIVSTPSALLDAHRIAACSKPTQVVYFESPKGLEQLLSLSSESKRDMFVCGYNRMLLEIKKFALK